MNTHILPYINAEKHLILRLYIVYKNGTFIYYKYNTIFIEDLTKFNNMLRIDDPINILYVAYSALIIDNNSICS